MSAPLGTYSAESVLGEIHEKLAFEPSFVPALTAAAAVEVKAEIKAGAPLNTTPAPTTSPEGGFEPGERILTKLYYTTGNEVYEVVEVLTEVTVTPVVATAVVNNKRANGEHVRRHLHHRRHVT